MSAIGPFPEPATGCKPAAAPALTAEQQTKYDELLADVRSWETLPTTSAKTAEATPLADEERLWLTRECLLRYLRATKWVVPTSAQRLRATLVWRREYGTDRFTADYISEENATGKQVLLGYDNEGRPCLYLLPQNQNTKETPKRVEHLVYMLEKTIDLHPPGQESLALLIDFRNTGAGGTPSMGMAKQVLNILQDHYPERLGRALLTHLPWYVTAFLKLINPFIDPVTKSKIKYNEPLTTHVPAAQLMKASGGSVDFKYDHSIYWPALENLTEQRRQERRQRWEKAGKLIGESEIYLWGGEEGSVGAGAAQDTTTAAPAASVEPAAPAAPVETAAAATPAAPVEGASSAAPVETKADDALVDGVNKLEVKDAEPVKTTA